MVSYNHPPRFIYQTVMYFIILVVYIFMFLFSAHVSLKENIARIFTVVVSTTLETNLIT